MSAALSCRWLAAACQTAVRVPSRRALHTGAALASTEGGAATLSLSDITKASFRIKGEVRETSVIESIGLSEMFGVSIFLKREFEQRTGSFKERGAVNVMKQLSPEEKKRGVCAASAGNHALALAYHGPRLGVPVTVIMPTVAPLTKVSNCRSFGAEIIIQGAHLLESRQAAVTLEEERGMTYVNGYDALGIITGQGTLGLELLSQLPDLDAVIVPIGGGGLIAGISLAVKSISPHTKVIGVEPERCASWTAALDAGTPVPVELSDAGTLADGLAVTQVGGNAFAVGKDLVDEVITVSESSIAVAILRLLELERSVVEGGGATGLAAFIDGKLDHLKGQKVGIILAGGNIDTPVLGRVIERGLAVDGRIHRLVARVTDRPGGIAHLASVLAASGGSIKDITHERAWLKHDISQVAVTVILETRDLKHAAEVQQALRDAKVPFRWSTVDSV